MRKSLWKLPSLGRLITATTASVVFFTAELVMSHLTHSITLLVSAYHMLYNIMSLLGCIATIKMCQKGSSLHNTFGWARLEVVSMIVNLLFVSALYFSTGVEAIQTLIHSSHTDSMHQPEIICILAGIGLVLNVFCILLIGGYTHHQGSFLALTPQGDVFIQQHAANEEAVRLGLRRLVKTERSSNCRDIDQFSIEEVETFTNGNRSKNPKDIRLSQKWPTLSSVFRDVASLLFVLISGLVVFFKGESFTSLIIDPILAILSIVIFIITSYPFVKQAGHIVLQTTPAHINIDELESKLKKAFPALVQIHDFHVWALTPERVIATAHLLFMNEQVYLRIKDSINDFFLSHGITIATIQPEFYKFGNILSVPSKGCVLSCCNQNTFAKPVDDIESHSHSHTCGDQHSHHSVVSEIQNVAAATVAATIVHHHCASTSISSIKEEMQSVSVALGGTVIRTSGTSINIISNYAPISLGENPTSASMEDVPRCLDSLELPPESESNHQVIQNEEGEGTQFSCNTSENFEVSVPLLK